MIFQNLYELEFIDSFLRQNSFSCVIILNESKKKLGIKIVLWGPSLSGKTSYLSVLHTLKKREADEEIRESYGKLLALIDEKTERTIAFDYASVAFDSSSEKLAGRKLHLFAIAGQERFKALRQIIVEGLDGMLIILRNDKEFDAENTESLLALSKITENTPIPYMLALNNIKTPKDRKITEKDIAELLVECDLAKTKDEALKKVFIIDTVESGKDLIKQIKAGKKDFELRTRKIDALVKPLRELLKLVIIKL